MARYLVALFIAVLATAVLVIEVRHESRLLFAALQQLQGQRDAVNTEWEQLLLEEGAWSQHRRVESMARARLDMSLPGREHIVIVRAPSAGP